MKTLTVRQPWAWAIVNGRQTVETRTWSTPYRGPLLIHAGLTPDFWGVDYYGLDINDLALGAIVGRVQVVGMERVSTREWEWLLEEPETFDEPIPAKGRLGLWEWEE